MHNGRSTSFYLCPDRVFFFSRGLIVYRKIRFKLTTTLWSVIYFYFFYFTLHNIRLYNTFTDTSVYIFIIIIINSSEKYIFDKLNLISFYSIKPSARIFVQNYILNIIYRLDDVGIVSQLITFSLYDWSTGLFIYIVLFYSKFNISTIIDKLFDWSYYIRVSIRAVLGFGGPRVN